MAKEKKPIWTLREDRQRPWGKNGIKTGYQCVSHCRTSPDSQRVTES